MRSNGCRGAGNREDGDHQNTQSGVSAHWTPHPSSRTGHEPPLCYCCPLWFVSFRLFGIKLCPSGRCFISLIRCWEFSLYEPYVLVRRVTRFTRYSAQWLKVALIIKLRHSVCGGMQPSDCRRSRGQLSIHLIGLIEHPRFPWALAPRNAVDRP
jgi:hypothetical protein